MKTWQITSEGGMDMGTFQGETAAEALLAMHRDAGLGADAVYVDEDGDLAQGPKWDAAWGDVDDCTVREVAGRSER